MSWPGSTGFRESKQPSLEGHWRINDELHSAVGRMAGSKLLQKMIKDVRMKTYIFDIGRVPEHFEVRVHEHVEIIDSVLAKAPKRAAKAMRLPINNAKQSIVRALEALFQYD